MQSLCQTASWPKAAELLLIVSEGIPACFIRYYGAEEYWRVLHRTKAAGVNRADCMQREGNYPPPPGASTVIGLECCGTVQEAGALQDSMSSFYSGAKAPPAYLSVEGGHRSRERVPILS